MDITASLYRISAADFSVAAANPAAFDREKMAKTSVNIGKTFDGLAFVLSKGRDAATVQLISEIFFPKTYLCIEPETEEFLSKNDFFEVFDNQIEYHAPDKVAIISALLDTISVEEFRKSFDPDELNEEAIYPNDGMYDENNDIWNDGQEENDPYNAIGLTKELTKLKEFYAIAKKDGDYIFTYVGN